MTPREYFESKGMLKECPNKPYTFNLGRLFCDLQWGSSCWSNLSDRGQLTDHWANLGVVHIIGGQKIYQFSIWRLAVFVAWAK